MNIRVLLQNIIIFVKKNKKNVIIVSFLIMFAVIISIFYLFSSKNILKNDDLDNLSKFQNNQNRDISKELIKDEDSLDEEFNLEYDSDSTDIENDQSIENSENKSISASKSSKSNSTNKSVGTIHIPSYPNLPSPSPAPKGKHVVGYYMCWSRYKGFNPEHIDTSKLTHLNYAFANINSDLSLGFVDSNIDLKNFESLRNIKKNNSNFRTLISIGGWDYSKYFSDAALNSVSRSIFAQNCLNFVLDHGFDGVDIDWEYPVLGGLAGNIYRSVDKQNYTLLLREIRNKLDQQSAKDGKNYYLTVAADPSSYYLSKVEIKNISSIVDFIFLMGYDYNGPWDHYANFNAPLYYRSDIPSAGQGSVSQGVNLCLNAGVPAAKMVLGVPFYAYKYTVTSANGLGSTFKGSSTLSYDDVVSKFLNVSSYKYFFDEISKVPYLVGNSEFISYENEQSITEKVNFAKSKGFAGVGAWEVSFDRQSRLLGVIHNLLKI